MGTQDNSLNQETRAIKHRAHFSHTEHWISDLHREKVMGRIRHFRSVVRLRSALLHLSCARVVFLWVLRKTLIGKSEKEPQRLQLRCSNTASWIPQNITGGRKSCIWKGKAGACQTPVKEHSISEVQDKVSQYLAWYFRRFLPNTGTPSGRT